MATDIPDTLIDTLLSLGSHDKEQVRQDPDLIARLADARNPAGGFGPEQWQAACETLSRDNQILLFRGLVYADILAGEATPDTAVNIVFAKLNTRCWPDTVFGLIGWAMKACEYHQLDTANYAFARMLKERQP